MLEKDRGIVYKGLCESKVEAQHVPPPSTFPFCTVVSFSPLRTLVGNRFYPLYLLVALS